MFVSESLTAHYLSLWPGGLSRAYETSVANYLYF